MVVIFCLILTQHSQSESGETDIFLENSTFPPSSLATLSAQYITIHSLKPQFYGMETKTVRVVIGL